MVDNTQLQHQNAGEDSPRRGLVIGYASCLHSGSAGTAELKQQADVIARECERLHLRLTELVGEREPATQQGPCADPGSTTRWTRSPPEPRRG